MGKWAVVQACKQSGRVVTSKQAGIYARGREEDRQAYKPAGRHISWQPGRMVTTKQACNNPIGREEDRQAVR
jgi:hypothetical protein